MNAGSGSLGSGECAERYLTASRALPPKEHIPSGAPRRRPFASAIRTTAAALLALAFAQMLDIHHPWWAAMTVWLVAQPTRGLLIERSLARLIGTICGAIAGALILVFCAQKLPMALSALAVWLALCSSLGTTFRHFRNYGFVLAGYTAGIVVLFGLIDGHADAGLAWDRVLCTAIGIVSSTLLSFRALPSKDPGAETHARSLLDRVLRLIGDSPAGTESHADASLVAEIGAFDRAIDEQAAGSFRRRFDALRLRHISGVLLELVALTRSPQGGIAMAAAAQDDPLLDTRQLAASAATAGRLALAKTLGDLAQALEPGQRAAWNHFRVDFDIVAAFRAAARPVLALGIASVIWLATGWQAGAMMAMTAVLFTSLFSSHNHGNQMVVQVLIGTLAGAAAGLLVRVFLFPHVAGLLPMLLCVMPFLLACAWLMSQPATGKMAIDMAMTFLLTAQPGTAPAPVEVVLPEAAAIAFGVFIAMGIFWLILPSRPDVRSTLLACRIVHLADLIARNSDRPHSESRHEALRSTQMRLLDVTPADSPIFIAAQACLATAAEARSQNSRSAREAVLEASATLSALITSNTRKKRNV
jgi:uncharacterized membrane protein YccC